MKQLADNAWKKHPGHTTDYFVKTLQSKFDLQENRFDGGKH